MVNNIELYSNIIYDTIVGQNCSFAYLAQPLSSTQQGCNPYSQQGLVRISFDCIVRRHSTVNNNYSIEWFRENTDGLVQCLGLGDPVSQLSNTDRSSRYHDNKFINQPYSPSLLGKYWCQVINTTADPDQPLMRSNVFTLLAPGDYSEPMCTSVQSSYDIVTCADEPDNQIIPSVVRNTQHLSSSLINITSHPSPTGSPMIPQSITPIIAGVSAGVVLVLIIGSMLIVIIIIMNRRKKQDKQRTHTGKITY